MQDRSTDAKSYLTSGNEAYHQGNFNIAIDLFSRALLVEPNFLAAYYNRSKCYQEIGEWDKALTDLEKCLEVNRQFPDAYHERGIILLTKKDYAGAMQAFNEAMKYEPGGWRHYLKRGDVYLAQDNHKKALADFEQSLRLQPKVAAIHGRLGYISYLNGDLANAMLRYEQALQLAPSYFVYFHRGMALQAQGKTLEALQAFQAGWQSVATTNNLISLKSKIYFGIPLLRAGVRVELLPYLQSLWRFPSANDFLEKKCLHVLVIASTQGIEHVKDDFINLLRSFTSEKLAKHLVQFFIELLMERQIWPMARWLTFEKAYLEQLKELWLKSILEFKNKSLKLSALLQILCSTTVLGNVFQGDKKKFGQICKILEEELSTETLVNEASLQAWHADRLSRDQAAVEKLQAKIRQQLWCKVGQARKENNLSCVHYWLSLLTIQAPGDQRARAEWEYCGKQLAENKVLDKITKTFSLPEASEQQPSQSYAYLMSLLQLPPVASFSVAKEVNQPSVPENYLTSYPLFAIQPSAPALNLSTDTIVYPSISP